MIYKYEAISATGEKIVGSYEGDSQREVIAMLRNNNYMPVMVEEDLVKAKSITIFKPKVGKRDIAIFCRQFTTMLNAGIGIVECINILEAQSENKTLKEALSGLYEDVQKGETLSSGMRKYEKAFPELLINMVESGEYSGNLDTIMERMSEHYEKENKLANKIKSAMIYPIVLGLVSVAVVVFLLVVVMPTFVEMFEDSEDGLPKPTQIVLNISNSMTEYWYIYLLVVIGIGVGIGFLKKTDRGRRIFDKIKLKLPIVKDTSIKIATARYTRTLSTLISSGISLIDAMGMVSKVIGNTIVEERLVSGIIDIEKGVPLSEVTRQAEVFPPMVDSMIEIGEESGAIDNVLFKTADFYDEEVEVALDRMAGLMEPIMIIVMGIMIGFIAVAMLLPTFEMANVL